MIDNSNTVFDSVLVVDEKQVETQALNLVGKIN